ncbi:hypothetical protein [Chiayiivirga flava]|uniref:Uncharacterized protein n=1 Tax=Chiayiivirga flava TaxID=659595 RepID=A0A7W8D5M5_9GAMM|nr:hypothetical protein [Chiayiivirga flava]MBB5207152.1 hypothetical protein [Chiayiivirga flava]
MAITPLRRCAMLCAFLLAAGWAQLAHAAVLQQSFDLRPGWNAIYLELDPGRNDIEQIFAGVPVESVWRWMPTQQGAQFIRDPAEGLENVEGWFAWFPQPRPEAFLTNLYSLAPNTAYLVKLGGSSNRTVTVTGVPKFVPRNWLPNGFSLTGLPVAPDNAPTFAEFFSESAAHAGQPVFTLQANGTWAQVTSPASTQVKSGQAYWIYTRGNSNYQGKLHVLLDQGDSLEYSAALDQIRVVLRNFSGVDGSFQIERLGSEPLPLALRYEDDETGEVAWPDLPAVESLAAPAGEDVFVTLAIKRTDLVDDRMDDVLAISDEHGNRVLLYAGGNTVQPGGALRKRDGSSKGAAENPLAFAGLWSGEVQIDAVSEAQRGGTAPVATAQPFTQRILIHVNNAGQARLLKDVIQMWEDGTSRPSSIDPSLDEVETPGRYVLITNKDLIGLYSGATNRAGTSVGIRHSTIGYDFDGETLDFTGTFGTGGQIATAIVIDPDLPTNPFLHRYHPDHDNLDEQFLNYQQEAFQVVRDIQMEFTPDDPLGTNPPGYGDSILGGTFRESITGLHKNAIFTSGKFRLRRISAVPVLNQ